MNFSEFKLPFTATRRVPHVEQDLLTLPEITPSFWWGTCCLFFSFLCCVMCTIVCLFVFFIFSHGAVSLFQISEFDCPFGSFRHSFTLINGIHFYFTKYAIRNNCFFRDARGRNLNTSKTFPKNVSTKKDNQCKRINIKLPEQYLNIIRLICHVSQYSISQLENKAQPQLT